MNYPHSRPIAWGTGGSHSRSPFFLRLVGLLRSAGLLGSAVLLACGSSGTGEMDSAGSAADVYSRVAWSVPWIETLGGVSSGVLVEDGYIVTNYHAVWPLDYARVVFPGGPDLPDVPVVGWDPVRDLAVLGPVEVSAPALEWQDDKTIPQGSELFLIGYPESVGSVLEASVTQGILMRRRDWEPSGVTHLLSDAPVVGGQNGGVLVDAEAKIVGIVTNTAARGPDEADFTIASSASDADIVAQLLIERSEGVGVVERLGYRSVDRSAVGEEHTVQLRNTWDEAVFAFESPAGSTVDFIIIGEEDGMFEVLDMNGTILEVDEKHDILESGTAEIVNSGMHLLLVGLRSADATADGSAASFVVEGSIGITPLADPDDGRAVNMGEVLAGAIDYAYDRDWYSVGLQEGDTVRIIADSAGADPRLCAAFHSSDVNDAVCSDYVGIRSSSNGMTHSELAFRAAESGEYLVTVTSSREGAFGGYYLSADSLPDDTAAPAIPPAGDSDDDSNDDPCGGVAAAFTGWDMSSEMQILRDSNEQLELQLPSSWVPFGLDALSEGVILEASDQAAASGVEVTRFESIEAASEMISRAAVDGGDAETGSDTSLELSTLQDMVDMFVVRWSSVYGYESILRSEPVETTWAAPAHRVEVHAGCDSLLMLYFTGLDNEIFVLAYVFPAKIWQDGVALADRSFSTMLFDGEPLLVS